MVSHSLPNSNDWKANAYIEAINGTVQWEYRAEEQLDEHYVTLSGALRSSLIQNDYSIFELVAAIFRSIINQIEGNPQAGARAFTEEYQPGRRIVEDAFSDDAEDRYSMNYMKTVAAIGSKWMMSLGPLSPETQPDIVWDDVGAAQDAYGDPIEPDPGFFGVTWSGLDGQAHQFIEQSSEPEWEVLNLEMAAAGVGVQPAFDPVVSETCGGTFADYIAYLVFPKVERYDPDPKFVWDRLSPVVRKALGVDENPYQTTMNRHFPA